MRAARIHDYGEITDIQIDEIPTPIPEDNEVLVATVASTINPVDVKMRTPGTPQQLPGFPVTLGWDFAGIVLQAPTGSRYQPGDRVIAMSPPRSLAGVWAETTVIPANSLVAAPKTVSLIEAATLPLAGTTAQQAVAALAAKPGDRVLVTGAIGAVGGIAVQLLTQAGCEVTGLISRPEHSDDALKLGATTVTTNTQELKTFDAIFDTAGIYDPALLGPQTRFVTISDMETPPEFLALGERFIHHYVQIDAAGLTQLVDMVDAGKLQLRVAQQFPLSKIHQAHETFEAGGLIGKVVIAF